MENNTSKPILLIKEKSVYGRTLLYPACDKSNIFAGLIKSKTFTYSDLTLIKGLGYEIHIITLEHEHAKEWQS